jgi:hypothetical protein
VIVNHIHDALTQVKKLQSLVLEKKNFEGYSGKSRIGGGIVALIGAIILGCVNIPETNTVHLIGWGIVLAVSMSLNYVSLITWFFFSPEARGSLDKLIPAVDALPALAVGAFLSLALIMHQQFYLLPGMWMSLYGLVHIPYRNNLPGANYLVGIFYIICGAVFLLFPLPFINPWPMGVVFFTGETAGGLIFQLDKKNY